MRTSPQRDRLRAGTVLVVLLVLTAAVYARALAGAFVYDDELLVVRNPLVHRPDWIAAAFVEPLWGPGEGYWRPLTALLLAAGHRLGGGAPFALHALSLALHLGAAAAAFALALALTDRLRVAAVAALLFAVHPVQVESVAWIAAINDPLWGLLALLALRAHLSWRARGSPGMPRAPALLCFAALLAKEPAIALPVAIVWLDVARGKRGRAAAPLRAYGPLALAVLAWVLLRIAVFGEIDAGLERAAVETGLSTARLWTLRVELLARFCAILCAPFPPDLFRDVPIELGAQAGGFAAPLLCALSLLAAAVVAWRRRATAALFGLGLIPLALAPGLVRPQALGAYPLADRYLYLAAFGFALAVASLLAGAALPRRLRRAGPIAAVALAAAYACTGFVRIGAWATQRALIDAGLRAHPDNPQLWYMRGHELLVQRPAGDSAMLDEACAAFARADELLARPRYAGPTLRRRLDADVRLGSAWCALAREEFAPAPRFERARRMFEAVTADHPRAANAWLGVGHACAKQGAFAAAEEAFERAVALEPRSAEAHRALGWFHATLGHPARARPHLEEALRLQPGDPVARQLLAELPQ